jgi:hypothetical protein
LTYLQLVNKVLLRLRERTVATVSGEYPSLIGDLVNEAKEDVERAWLWKARRFDVTFTTSPGLQDYFLGASGVASTATNERSKLMYAPGGAPMAFNLTEPYKGNRMIEVERETHKEWIADDNSANTQPYYFSLYKNANGWGMSIYPKPDNVYTLQATFYIPQAALANDTDILGVPEDPVWRYALAYAASERGEGVGSASERYEARAARSLNEAIGREADCSELTFYED